MAHADYQDRDSVRFCIVGAGAVGGHIGARVAASGHPTSAVARGETLDALRRYGWRLRDKAGSVAAPVRASDDASELGEQDVVVLAVKAPSLVTAVRHIPPLLHANTVVLTALNGVPWWFFHGFGNKYQGLHLSAVDPDGSLTSTIPTQHVLGAVVHFSASIAEPGVILNHAGRRLIVGEPDGSMSARLAAVVRVLHEAGFDVDATPAIQKAIWYKLWGNMTMNPVSVLTGATTDLILADELVEAFCQAVMREAATIGAEVGCPIEENVEDRNNVTRELGTFKTSMLRDAESGKPLEIDAMLTAVREIATATGIPTPFNDSLLGLTRLNARVRGLYPWSAT